MVTAEFIFQALFDELSNNEKLDVAPLCAEFLRDNDWFVAEDEDELADLALEHTDLVEPTEE
jgi:hypothetical protein